jgi:prepilin-type N-terminal cleavage/methylation domain-containing protein/prepilin-type processing-associated H-X9-DG protein
MTKKHKKMGFTLIELLVVISIIAVLMAIMMPALSRVREQAKQVTCMSNMKSLAQATMVYSNDYEGRYPLAGSRDDAGGLWGAYPYSPYWDARLLPYLGASGVDIEVDANKTTDSGKSDDWGKYESAIEVFACPSSRSLDRARVDKIEANNQYARTYKFNAYLGGMVTRPSDGYYLQDKSYRNSLKTDSVNGSSRTLMFTESQLAGAFNTLWGHQARGWFDVHPAHFVKFDGPTERPNDWGAPRSFGKSGFAFADGHVENLSCQFTESYNTNPGPAFTDYADPIDGLKFHPTSDW